MEVHAQVLSKSKLFSGASTEFGAEPNSQVSFIDAGFPGMLPVINAKCVEQAVRTGLGLKAKINLRSIFDRKNYFYPDLPQGYQISQYKDPIVGEGEVTIDLKDGSSLPVRIERLHLEQDAGKSLHDQHPDSSYVDLNRSGIALMEIVTKPDMRSSRGSRGFPEEIARHRALSGHLRRQYGRRLDAGRRQCLGLPGGGYAKFRETGDFKHLGTRCEIKNVNSMRFIAQAVEYEARRQVEIIEGGGTIKQETRLFDARQGETRSMRSKEEAHDYRYFPDPDLLPLELDADMGGGDRKIPARTAGREESPADQGRVCRPMTPRCWWRSARLRIISRPWSRHGADAKAAANWLNNEYFGRLNKAGLSIADGPVSAKANAEIVMMVAEATISGKIAKDVLDIEWAEKTGAPRAAIVEARGMKQVTDTSAIDAAIEAVIAANPDKVEEVKAKPKLAAWFVGQVMKQTGGKANPAAVNAALKAQLNLPEEG